MKICVVGWYFDREFIRLLHLVNIHYPVFIVCHRPPEYYFDLPFVVTDNVGLEFGAYSWYLDYAWDGHSNVFFTHDDTKVEDINTFHAIAEIPHDCAYVFRDEAEEKANGGKHGRAIFCSSAFLKKLSEDGGFWYDEENTGYNGNGQPRPIRADGMPMDFNAGIFTFHKYLGNVRDQKIGLDVVNRVFVDSFEAGRRGTWRHKEREKARYGRIRP